MISEIVWPLYGLRVHSSIQERNNVLYITTEYGEHILDNKNLSGSTLGMRRLQLKNVLKNEYYSLYRLTGIYYNITDVIQSKKSKVYIDTAGIIHNFTRKTRRELKYYKVKDIQVHDNTLLCYCRGLSAPLFISYIPTVMPLYLGLVKVEGALYVYELSSENKKNTWRLL